MICNLGPGTLRDIQERECVCVCVCVCGERERERKRERERERERERDTDSKSAPSRSLVESLKRTPTLESESWYPRPYLSL